MMDAETRTTILAMTKETLDVQALAIADVHEYLTIPRPNTRLFAIASFVSIAKLHALGRGLSLLLRSEEDESASVLLRPTFETAAACCFLHRADPTRREALAKRFLMFPITKGLTKYLRKLKNHGRDPTKQVDRSLREMEKVETELRSGPGGLNSWHGGDVKALMSGAGLDDVNSSYVELLHADMHGPVPSQYLKGDRLSMAFEVRGTGSRALPTVGLAYILWCSGVMQSEVLAAGTRAQIAKLTTILMDIHSDSGALATSRFMP